MQAARLENIFQLQSEPELESWHLFSAGLVQAKNPCKCPGWSKTSSIIAQVSKAPLSRTAGWGQGLV